MHMRNYAVCLCCILLLALLTTAGSVQAANQLPELKAGWQRIYIENVGRIDLPPTIPVLGLGVSRLHAGNESLASVLVTTKIFDEQLNFYAHDLIKQDIAKLDVILKHQLQQVCTERGYKISEWQPVKIEKLNGMSYIHANYIVQINGKPMLFHAYDFANNDRNHTIVLSCPLSDADYWKADFAAILESLRITNVRGANTEPAKEAETVGALRLPAQAGSSQATEASPKQVKSIVDGFRGVPWGIRENESDKYGLTKSSDSYIKKDENMSLGYVQLDYVKYHFHNGRFFAVELVSGHKDREELFGECDKLFSVIRSRVEAAKGKQEWDIHDVTIKWLGSPSVGYYGPPTVVITKNDKPKHTGGGL